MNFFITIIIPAFNAESYIKECLDSLVNLDFPKKNFEIIVMDNGSSDRTVEIAQGYDVTILTAKGCTISTLRNLGAARSKGNILAFIDADCIANKGWLKEAVSLLEREHVGAVGSWYELPLHPTYVEEAWDVHMRNRRIDGQIDWLPSGNFIVLKEVFNRVGGFNETLITGEDVDICRRIRRTGSKIISDKKIAVIHLGNPKTVREFFQKQIWHGKGGLQILLDKFPKIKLNKIVFFSLAVTLLFINSIVSAVIWYFYGDNRLFFISAPAFAGLLLLVSVKSVMHSRKYSYIFVLPLLFFVYALGRTLSLFDFNIWKSTIKDTQAVM